MRLLVDHNLPYSLAPRLADIFPGSASVSYLGLATASDAEIWDRARLDGYVLVTKDSDFADPRRHPGPPPKVVIVAVNNATVAELEAVIRIAAPDLLAFEADPSRSIVVR